MAVKPIIGIYAIRNLVNDKYYVGQSDDIDQRWNEHRSNLRLNKNKPSKRLQSTWNYHGEESFEFIILEECSIDELTEKEQQWLDFIKTGHEVYNVGDCVDATMRGVKLSEEHKKKIGDSKRGKKRKPYSPEHIAKLSAAGKGKKNALGFKQTEETKTKISEANKGKIVSDETKAKMSASKIGNKNWVGKKHSAETKAKMSASMKGKKHGPLSIEHKAKISASLKGNKRRLGKEPWNKGRRKNT